MNNTDNLYKVSEIKNQFDKLQKKYQTHLPKIDPYLVYELLLRQQKNPGAEYGDMAEQLKKHASQELAHALEVARQIDYLGGDPTMKGKEAEYSRDSKTMLEIDLRAEQETIKSYRERIRQAERAGEYALSETLRV
jgi:bacterioferritin (cytochrome b1)